MNLLPPPRPTKEAGCGFIRPMVREILVGIKTQTRRPLKTICHLDGPVPETGHILKVADDKGTDGFSYHKKLPWRIGDTLWVRETHLRLRAGDGILYSDHKDYDASHPSKDPAKRWKVIPSLLMPRPSARILLPVLDLRVELVRSISPADAAAEGFSSQDEFLDTWCKIYPALDLNSSRCLVTKFHNPYEQKR